MSHTHLLHQVTDSNDCGACANIFCWCRFVGIINLFWMIIHRVFCHKRAHLSLASAVSSSFSFSPLYYSITFGLFITFFFFMICVSNFHHHWFDCTICFGILLLVVSIWKDRLLGTCVSWKITNHLFKCTILEWLSNLALVYKIAHYLPPIVFRLFTFYSLEIYRQCE